MTRESAERRRDALEEELILTLDRLEVYVGSKDRISKVTKAMSGVELLMQKLTTTTEQMTAAATEGQAEADKEWMTRTLAKTTKVLGEAQTYANKPPADAKSRSAASSAKTSSTTRKAKLMADIQEEQRKAEADMEIQQAEFQLIMKKSAEANRQKIQQLVDEAKFIDHDDEDSETSKSEKSLNQANVITHPPNSQALVTSWLDMNPGALPTGQHPAANSVQSAPVFANQHGAQTSQIVDSPPLPTSQIPGNSVTPIPPSTQVVHNSITTIPLSNPVVDNSVTPHPPSNIPADYAHYALPKWQLKNFDGNPLHWPEWKGMFASTVMRAPITNEQKMNHLKTLVTGRAKVAIAGIAYSGEHFEQAWSILERKFGRPHVIISAQLDKIQNYPPVRMHNSTAIIDFSVTVSNLICVFEQLGYKNDLNSASNLQLLVTKLPPNMKEKWFGYITSRCWDSPSIKEFDTWLQRIADTHEHVLGASASNSHSNFTNDRNNNPKSQRVGSFAANTNNKPPLSCILCKANHRLPACDIFRSKTPTDRAFVLKENKLCFCCLNGGHSFRACKFGKPCGTSGCTKSHHFLIHGANPVYQPSGQQPGGNQGFQHGEAPKPVITGTQSSPMTSNKGFLQIIPILVHGETSSRRTFALCDLGSTHSWVDSEFATSIGYKNNPVQIIVNSIQDSHVIDTSIASLSISSLHHDSRHELQAYVKDHLALGNEVIDVKKLKERFTHLSPILSNSLQLGDIKVLLGQDVFSLIRPLEYRYADNKQPWAVRLPLGWVLSGPVPKLLRENCESQCYHTSIEDKALSEQVKRWLDMEEFATTEQGEARSSEDKHALQILDSATTHNGTRYCVGLLWSKDATKLPNNYKAAYSQLLTLERRLAKQPALKTRYVETIQIDFDKGYIRAVEKDELNSTYSANQWYLPHHPVLHPHKPDKIRRVCNAASKYMGTSLNDALIVGPDLLNSLIGILIRFRQHAIAITADIEAMFLQVEVTESDQRVLRFLWREDPTKEVKVYQYTRHVFGTKDSPTVVNYILRRTAIDNQQEFPQAAAAVPKSFYMDDFIKSVPTPEEASTLQTQLCSLLHKGGFNLTKFTSNSKQVKDSIPDNISLPKDETSMHILGIKWDIDADTLAVSRGLHRTVPEKPTQRDVLAYACSVFDPMGVFAPFTVSVRLLLKKIWKAIGQHWDQPINNEHCQTFQNWVISLESMQSISLPRVFFNSTPSSIQLHVFGDASLDAMCAVAYLLGHFINQPPEVIFVIGKCRVAPMNQATIPKLELQASVIAARLKTLILTELELPVQRCVMWTDSTTALQWVQSSHKKQQIFVANRTAEILQHTTVDEWRYIPGELNPSDCGTRGLNPTELKASNWLYGPPFLKLPESQWPAIFVPTPVIEEQIVTTNVSIAKLWQPVVQWERFSQFRRLVRTIAYIFRLRSPKASRCLPLQADDIKSAQLFILKLSQYETFAKEFKLISSDQQLPHSVVSQLSPFIDECGVLRAKGRTRKAPSISYAAKHPIILDSRHRAVKLFLLHIHQQNHHQGLEHQRSILNQEFWIVHLRSTLRAIKNNCVTCRRSSASTLAPEMADLPSERLNDRCFPFSACGIDYFGPLQVRIGRKQHLKRWICLITCLSTRAIHLEVCHTLSSDSCILALQRFISRRGRPQSIISDNGTNFVGCNNELKALLDLWNSECVQSALAMEQIKWKFNPPASPHFGGVWERMVRSCKKAMYNILGARCLTDELLLTIMCLVEQLLNSRPLVPASSDVTDFEALTPNHFLLGRPSICLPLFRHASNDTPSYRRVYKNSEIYTNWIWSRWLTEYMPTLNCRKKWHQTDKDASLSVGDMVWLVDPTTPRGYYPMARILKLNYGDDGVARSASIKTPTSEYTRPLVKLVPVLCSRP